jgi:hypothetical protein
MNCIECGAEILDTSKFCQYCGIKKNEGESTISFDEKWETALNDLEKKQINDIQQLIEELKIEADYVKKYGKEPEARTPDGSINKKYITYILRRDYGIEPDSNMPDPYENFSWGGLTGMEAYIAKMNCD